MFMEQPDARSHVCEEMLKQVQHDGITITLKGIERHPKVHEVLCSV